MKRATTVIGLAALVGFAGTTPAQAITFGLPDGSQHPQVGVLVADVDPGSPGPEALCSGTLIADDVFLTAGHCTAGLPAPVGVSFDNPWVEDDVTSEVYWGEAVTHPDFFSGGRNNPYDIAVVLLDERVTGIEPAQLPPLGLLDDLAAAHELREATFTTVGYGVLRDSKTKGPQALRPPTGERRYAFQSALSLTGAWFTLSMNPATGNGGTCYGDSGGPHFLGGAESTLLVSLTATGDRFCRATDQTYRLDTPWVRDFLAPYVAP